MANYNPNDIVLDILKDDNLLRPAGLQLWWFKFKRGENDRKFYWHVDDIGKELNKRAMRILNEDEGFMTNPGLVTRLCLVELYKKEQVVPFEPNKRPILNMYWRVKDDSDRQRERSRPEGRVMPNEMLAEIASNLSTYESIWKFAQGNKDTLSVAKRELFERAKYFGIRSILYDTDEFILQVRRLMKLHEMECKWIKSLNDFTNVACVSLGQNFDLIFQFSKETDGTEFANFNLSAIGGTKFNPQKEYRIYFNVDLDWFPNNLVNEPMFLDDEDYAGRFYYDGEYVRDIDREEYLLWAPGVYRIQMHFEADTPNAPPEDINALAIFSLPKSQLNKYEKKWYPYQREGDIKPPTGLI